MRKSFATCFPLSSLSMFTKSKKKNLNQEIQLGIFQKRKRFISVKSKDCNLFRARIFSNPYKDHSQIIYKLLLKLSSLLDHLLNVHATKFLPAKSPNFDLNNANLPLLLVEASGPFTWPPTSGSSTPFS